VRNNTIVPKIIISKTDNTSTPVKSRIDADGRKLVAGTDYNDEAGRVH